MERYIEACYFDGNLYGLPTYRDLASQAGFMCRADILEELGYKAEDIKNFDDIEEVLKKCQEVHPELYPMIPSDLNSGCFLNYVKGEFDVVTSGVGVDIDDDASDGITVINTYDTEKYKEMTGTRKAILCQILQRIQQPVRICSVLIQRSAIMETSIRELQHRKQ